MKVGDFALLPPLENGIPRRRIEEGTELGTKSLRRFIDDLQRLQTPSILGVRKSIGATGVRCFAEHLNEQVIPNRGVDSSQKITAAIGEEDFNRNISEEEPAF